MRTYVDDLADGAFTTTVDDLAESYFQHELMNETRAYIERGRRLERSSDQDVMDAWVAAFEHGLEHRTSEDARNMEDAAAELRLRGLEEPHERVRSKIDALRAEMERLGPDALLEGLDPQRIKDFLAALWGPKN
jgi:hypothetical protein